MDDKFKTPWSSAKELIEKLKIGDLIEFKRCAENGMKIYTHWGVYIGSRHDVHGVAHLTNGGNNDKMPKSIGNSFSIGSAEKALIRVDDIFDISGCDDCRINNSMDRYCEPLPGIIIYSRVKNRMGDYGYSLFNNNCEHFAKWARYNLSTSSQAKLAKSVMYGIGILTVTQCPFTSLAATGLGYLGLEGYDLVRKYFPVDSCFKNWAGN
uniref:LRAT domain-containing protein n=1 Tax=Strongyloides papillosus TaxID=174720 RepID=A0A0N5BZ16_STREA